MRNALSLVAKATQQMVGATKRTVFVQPDARSAREQWRRVADGFRSRFPRLAGLMNEAEGDVLSYAAFPAEHWQKVWSKFRKPLLYLLSSGHEKRLTNYSHALEDCNSHVYDVPARDSRSRSERDPAAEDDVRVGRGLAGADDELGPGNQTP